MQMRRRRRRRVARHGGIEGIGRLVQPGELGGHVQCEQQAAQDAEGPADRCRPGRRLRTWAKAPDCSSNAHLSPMNHLQVP